MVLVPIQYDEPVFRPPAEALSAILQVTLGCSWNKCAFCEMYSSKKFRLRKFEQIQHDLAILASVPQNTRKMFLADGNAMVLSADRMLKVLSEVQKYFPKLQRVSSYALPADISAKSMSELEEICDAGLKLLYIGIESGDDELLNLVQKGETFKSTVEGIIKAHRAGFQTSIMVINGLGGRKYSRQHAIRSADLINQITPRFLSTLTLSLPFGIDRYRSKFSGKYLPMTNRELATELKQFLTLVHVDNCIFRSDHVSNQLVLKGRLQNDKKALIKKIDDALTQAEDDLYPVTPEIL